MTEMHEVEIREMVDAPRPVFADRSDAGEALAGFLELEPDPEALVMALPRGGVPVGEPLARRLEAPLRLAVARKLPVPQSPEMGFGAVALGGEPVFNEELARRFGIDEETRRRAVETARRELRRRADAYAAEEEDPSDVQGRIVYLVDDGLATGYTALAACGMLREYGARAVRLAVPVSPETTLREAGEHFDSVVCLIAQRTHPFAVASFYRDFHDLSDAEVRKALDACRGMPRRGFENDERV